ncbi:hypothetical protein ID866_7809 [Astraeus odoratus]|nr:hypothetical protein ID866_7809 [Astraeus odoratus]
MHSCLLIDEILQNIFTFIDKRSDLYALARTCRTLNRPAIDLLWETLTEIAPLLRTLSCIRHSTRGIPYIVRELTLEDWKIFQRLSQRVHKLHISFSYKLLEKSSIDLRSLCYLANPPDPSLLFPKVHTFSVIQNP